MIDSQQIRAHQLEQLRKDLSSFSDPGTLVEISEQGKRVVVNWNLHRQERTDTFSISPTEGIKHYQSGDMQEYRSFLASEAISDLYGLAGMILQASPKSIFVKTKARLSDEPDEEKADALESIQRLVKSGFQTELDGTYTSLLMVKGQAGAGKTEVLRELVKRQAEDFKSGASRFIYLYVDAQGRALTRLNEAFAVELQDLRAKLTYHQIATLVREELIVPVIDGFDELIGVSGYEDAFGSLTAFLDELGGRGSVIASARNLFYEREFLSRASRATNDAWVLRAISVEPWGEGEHEEYVRLVSAKKGFDDDRANALIKQIFNTFVGANRELGKKPFFVAKTLSLLIDGYLEHERADLREALVEGFIKRETEEKLLDSDGNPILSFTQVKQLLQEVAEEMWNSAVRELDTSAVKEVADYVTEMNQLGESLKKILLERITTMAFFRRGTRFGRIAFEHEMFLEFFLASVAIEKIFTSKDQVRVFASRGTLENDVCSEIERQLLSPSPAQKEPQAGIMNISAIDLPYRSGTTTLQENMGKLICSLLRVCTRLNGKAIDLTVSDLIFKDSPFDGIHLKNCKFIDCQFVEVDFSNSSFQGCLFKDCYLFKATIDSDSTVLNVDGIALGSNIQGLVVRRNGAEEEYFKESDIAPLLAGIGVSGMDARSDSVQLNVDSEVEDLVHKMATAYRRANPICKGDQNLGSLFEHPRWESVEKALKRYDLVTEENRGTSGRKVSFLRRHFLPDQLLAARSKGADVPDALKRFWKELAP